MELLKQTTGNTKRETLTNREAEGMGKMIRVDKEQVTRTMTILEY